MQSEHKKILMLLVMLVFVIGMASALVFEQGTDVDIRIVCINAGFCSGSTECNVSVFSPNQTILLDGVTATPTVSLASYNVSLNSSQTAANGEYSVAGFCKDGSVTNVVDFNFDVTPTGTILKTSESILYFLFLSLLIIFFFTSLFWSIRLPFKNVVNAEGEIVSINDLKYLKIFLIAMSYTLLMWIFGILQAVTKNFLFFFGIDKVFLWMYNIMLAFIYPAIVLTFLFALLVFINDRKLFKAITRFDFK